MDRAQKELYDTYLRKRKIAFDQGDNLNVYEITPDSIEYFELSLKYLNNLFIVNIVTILSKHPKLIDYFRDRLDEFDNDDIYVILSNQPQLINYFKDRLGEFDVLQIFYILLYQPQLIDYFKDRLGRLGGGFFVYEILLKHPKLIDYFKDKLGELEGDYVDHLTSKHPQLEKYFE